MRTNDIDVLIFAGDTVIDRMDDNNLRTVSGFSGDTTVHFEDGGVMGIGEIRLEDIRLESEVFFSPEPKWWNRAGI